MNRIINFLFILCVATLSSCNDTDNLTAIFTKSPKKVTALRYSNHKEVDFWNTPQEKEESNKLKLIEGNYTLNFDGIETNGKISGTITGRIVNSSFTGDWGADGKTNSMYIKNIKYSGSEKDILAINFKTALEGVYKYVGDNNSLSLYYKDGQYKNKYIGFVNDDSQKK